MRSRRTRRKYERIVPRPELVIAEVAAPTLSIDDLQPSRARERPKYERGPEDDAIFASITREFLEATELDFEVRFEHGEYQRAFIEVGTKQAGALIGKRGAGLDAIETLLSRMASHRAGHPIPVQVDVNEYRSRREDELREEALALAERVRQTGEDEHLPPMGARDRRVVHLAVKALGGLETFSVGEGASKHIVIHKTSPG